MVSARDFRTGVRFFRRSRASFAANKSQLYPPGKPQRLGPVPQKRPPFSLVILCAIIEAKFFGYSFYRKFGHAKEDWIDNTF